MAEAPEPEKKVGGLACTGFLDGALHMGENGVLIRAPSKFRVCNLSVLRGFFFEILLFQFEDGRGVSGSSINKPRVSKIY